MTAASSCCPSWEDASLMVLLPAAPLASPSSVSLVLVSPSTEICQAAENVRHSRACFA